MVGFALLLLHMLLLQMLLLQMLLLQMLLLTDFVDGWVVWFAFFAFCNSD